MFSKVCLSVCVNIYVGSMLVYDILSFGVHHVTIYVTHTHTHTHTHTVPTLHALLKCLLFTEDGEPHLPDSDEADTEVIDVTDPEVFLLVYKWYLSPEKLVDCLIE